MEMKRSQARYAVADPEQPGKRFNLFWISSFILVAAYSLWAASVGWNTPLNLSYDFVQAKAAISTYYLANGGPILRYELPIFGPPWSMPYEFPFYQLITAALYKLQPISLETAGRFVSKFFFYLACMPLIAIAKHFHFRGKAALIPAALFLASPIYLFWSRQFMIESTALFFGLAYLATVMAWARKPTEVNLVMAILLGVAAALSKSTTYATFGMAVGLLLIFELARGRSRSLGQWLRAAAILALPLLAGLLWLRFTDQVKNTNPFGAAFTSSALGKWYLFSGWNQRLDGALWYHFFRITLHDAIGHRAVWLLSLALAACLGKKAWLYWLCSALFLAAPLLFTQAHLAHDYYANANAIFLVFGIAALVQAATDSDKRWIQIAGITFFILAIGYECREFLKKGYLQQQESRVESIEFAKKLRPLVTTDDVMLMYGEDWCPLIPFYAQRRAIMMWNGNWYNPQLEESLSLLRSEGKKLGAIVLCHEAKTDPQLLSQLALGPLLLRDVCDVYKPSAKKDFSIPRGPAQAQAQAQASSQLPPIPISLPEI